MTPQNALPGDHPQDQTVGYPPGMLPRHIRHLLEDGHYFEAINLIVEDLVRFIHHLPSHPSQTPDNEQIRALTLMVTSSIHLLHHILAKQQNQFENLKYEIDRLKGTTAND